MSWILIAKKDFRDAIRSRMIWGLTLLFMVFAGGLTFYLYFVTSASGGTASGSPVGSIMLPMVSASSTFVPLVGLATAYKSIVGERESGSIKLLLAFPHTRFDVMFGKLVGRSLVVSVAIVVGYVAGIIPLLVSPFRLSVSEFSILLLMTVLLGIVSVGIAIAFSTAMRSSRRALYGAIGLFVLFEWLWNRLPRYLEYVLNGFASPRRIDSPEWVALLNRFNPQTAYQLATASLSPQPVGGLVVLGTDQPFYLRGWFAFVILALWLVVPLGFAYHRFRSVEL